MNTIDTTIGYALGYEDGYVDGFSSGGGGSGDGWDYPKNYGNLGYWSWVYDLTWDGSTVKSGCLLNKEDWPRYVYIWLYRGAYYVTFFNYLFDRVDSFTNTVGSDYFWNIDRSLTCVSYQIDIVSRKILSSGGQNRNHNFDLATHINTNSSELFEWLTGEDGEYNRPQYFRMCDTSEIGFWSNWGGFKRNHYAGSYDILLEKLCKKTPMYRRKKYYIWLWNNNYYITTYDTYTAPSTFTGLNTWTFNNKTLELISNTETLTNGNHGWWAVRNIESCDQSMIDYVHSEFGSKLNEDGTPTFPAVEGGGWHNLSAFEGFY